MPIARETATEIVVVPSLWARAGGLLVTVLGLAAVSMLPISVISGPSLSVGAAITALVGGPLFLLGGFVLEFAGMTKLTFNENEGYFQKRWGLGWRPLIGPSGFSGDDVMKVRTTTRVSETSTSRTTVHEVSVALKSRRTLTLHHGGDEKEVRRVEQWISQRCGL
jgi:hypothetical protein